MSEAELHILQGRMHQALLNKARRGDLSMQPPVGYVRLPAGGFGFDPDEQAQDTIRLIFDQFDRLGSVRRVLRYLHQQDIKLPVRPHAGPNKGEIEWRRATRELTRTVLMHPLYAGTYRYGHRQTDRRRKTAGKPESGRIVVPPDQYHALIPDHSPAYITRERHKRNQQRIRENRNLPDTKGAPRNGSALLSGILFCGRCGLRMAAHYPGVAKKPRYVCTVGKDDCEVPACQCLTGRVVDELVTEKLLQALEPAALELSLRAAGDLQQERQRLDQNWQQRLERARFEADRTHRQFTAVEPENRLVARDLERRWESALREQENLEQEYARFRQTHPVSLSDSERDLIRSLSKNLPEVWSAPTTTSPDRQRIIRILIERVVINIEGTSNRVNVALHWFGGFTSQHELLRPVLRYEQMADYEQLVNRIEELRGQRKTFTQIADYLNQEGFHPLKQAESFHKDIVNRLFNKICQKRPVARQITEAQELQQHEWFAIDLAAELEMPKNTLLEWLRRGWVHVTRQLPGKLGRKICWADPQELVRLRRLRAMKRSWWDPPLPDELITPKISPTD